MKPKLWLDDIWASSTFSRCLHYLPNGYANWSWNEGHRLCGIIFAGPSLRMSVLALLLVVTLTVLGSKAQRCAEEFWKQTLDSSIYENFKVGVLGAISYFALIFFNNKYKCIRFKSFPSAHFYSTQNRSY
jgi:hypothetical protein